MMNYRDWFSEHVLHFHGVEFSQQAKRDCHAAEPKNHACVVGDLFANDQRLPSSAAGD